MVRWRRPKQRTTLDSLLRVSDFGSIGYQEHILTPSPSLQSFLTTHDSRITYIVVHKRITTSDAPFLVSPKHVCPARATHELRPIESYGSVRRVGRNAYLARVADAISVFGRDPQ